MSYHLFALVLAVFVCTSCAGKHSSYQGDPPRSVSDFHSRLNSLIADRESDLGATIGVSLMVPYNSEADFEHNGDRLFHAASTMKIPVMVEAFKRAKDGQFKMTDMVVVNENYRSYLDDSPFVVDSDDYLAERIGQEVSILTLVEQMMVVSDNLATNQLISMMGASKITGTMRKLGANTGYVLRGVQDIPAYEAGLSNRLTPNDLTAMLDAIEKGEAGDDEGTEEMKRILLAQEYNDMIPLNLPDDVQVGHKTGSISGHRHDAATIYAPFGTYYLVVMTEDLNDGDKGKLAAAEISKFIYDYLAQ